MSDLLKPHFTWMFFFGTVVFLLLFYGFLQFLKNQIPQLPATVKFKERLSRRLRYFLLLYELIFVVISVSIFMLIHPLWHGMIVLFLISITFPLMRDYMIGRFLCFDPEFQQGKRITVGEDTGVINKMNRLGIYVITNNGMKYINYMILQENGFSLLTDSLMQEYCDLNISANDKDTSNLSAEMLLYKLMGVPYLDSDYRPTLITNNTNTDFQIRVLIRKGNHQQELINLIKDWGYDCQLSH
ncbi:MULTISPECIES: hypothetical protein [unclassified Aureispira]|uniref:hypothetical protein n=1 Tax=unclassified Aureispira TaxID=2649989 RepID=UPI0006970F8D|nr:MULTISPECIES: hypothetical protein [unclassified Aureispira]WMX16363.1 hypothetical protein QP953_08290 [Aureispira sp. CCB-E]